MKIFRTLAVSILALFLGSFAARANDITGPELKKALENNPDVLINAIKTNKKAIFAIISEAANEEQARMQKEAAEAETKAFEDSFKNPFTPEITGRTRIRGEKNAKYTLVEYSDFQCPYCARGYQTVEDLRKKYGKDLRVIFKNLPLQFHPLAMPAAKWLEAVSLQSHEKAWMFHDILFASQDKLSVDFFKATAKDLGVDMARCEKDVDSQEVMNRISADIAEAQKYGFGGTPGFLLNGIPVRGAYPVEYFERIMKRLEAGIK